MAKAALHYDDLIKDATLTASSEAGTLAVENLQNYHPRRIWRGATEEETITANFGKKELIQATWLIRHNCSAEATARIRISDNSDLSSPTYDADFYVWPSLEGYDEGVYDGTRFIGYDGAPNTAMLPREVFNATFILANTNDALVVRANDGNYLGQYLGITIKDDSGTDVEAGVWRAGRYFMPEYDITANRQFGFADPSQRIVSVGQDVWVSAKNKSRIETFAWDFLHENEVNTDMFLLGAVSGTSRPVIYMPFVENSVRSLVGTIYGLLDEWSVQQVRKQYNHYSYATQMTIRSI